MLVLSLATLGLVAGGAAYVALHWRPDREDRLFFEGREADGALQTAAETQATGPSWLRVNLRDGRVLVARHAAGEAPRYEVGVAAAEPDAAMDGAEWLLERTRTEGGLSEEVAILDAEGRRIGAMVPTSRRIGLPFAFDAHLPGRRYVVRGREVELGGETVARLFTGPFERLVWLQWGAVRDPSVRLEAALLLLAVRWTDWAVRGRRLDLLRP